MSNSTDSAISPEQACGQAPAGGSVYQNPPSSDSVRISGFIGDSIVDGPGLRCVVFTQGCPHHCDGCHNPQTHPFEGGKDVCCADLFEKIRGYRLTSGVTFSGGEPFCQAAPLSLLAKMVKDAGLELAIYTGFTFEQLYNSGNDDVMRLLSLADVLIDGRFVKERRNLCLKFRGSENQRIIDVQKSLLSGSAVINDSERWNNI